VNALPREKFAELLAHVCAVIIKLD